MWHGSRWQSGKESASQCKRCRRYGFDSCFEKIPRRRKWQPTLVVLPGISHWLRSLADYSPWSCKELDVMEWLSMHEHRVTLSVIQWLRVCLPMQGTGVQSRVREDPTRCNAIKPTCHNCWACTLEPVFHNKRCHHNEKSVHLKEEEPLLTTVGESLHTAAKTQFSQEKEKKTRWETFSTQYLI